MGQKNTIDQYTYRVEIVNRDANLLLGRVGQTLPQAMKLVADEMNAKNTSRRTISIYTERGSVVFAAMFDGMEWKLS
jgi:hypothetical protein